MEPDEVLLITVTPGATTGHACRIQVPFGIEPLKGSWSSDSASATDGTQLATGYLAGTSLCPGQSKK